MSVDSGVKHKLMSWAPVAYTCNPSLEIRRIRVLTQPRQMVHDTLPQKTLSQKLGWEWLKVRALSSSPSTTKKTSSE
jgi:hypothetical protein